MASPRPIPSEDERLPLILGFQRIAENTAANTRFIDHGKGIYVYDTDGREYIEATSSFYVAALGYQHDELIDAIEAQYRELPFFVSGMNRTGKNSLDLAEQLVEILPVNDAHIVYASSGSEANDFLIKMLYFGAVARDKPNKRTIISRLGSYHGGTLGSASLTGVHHEEFALPLPGFRHIAQPDFHGERYAGESAAAYSARMAAELRTVVEGEPDDSVAAFFAEPISFSAGFKVPPPGYFEALTGVLNEHDIDFCVDEVVTGMGRTGNMFGAETLSLKPDHTVIAKGITSGYFPFSVIAIGRDLYDALEAGSDRVGTFAHASTMAAHPVGAAAALKMLEIIKRDKLVEHGRRMGEQMAAGLNAFADHPLVGEIRAVGLGAAIDFLKRGDDDEKLNDDGDDIALEVYQALMDAGVVGRPTGRSVVLAPPLIVQPDEIDEIVLRMGKALDTVLAQRGG